jgi:hypothetical protein
VEFTINGNTAMKIGVTGDVDIWKSGAFCAAEKGWSLYLSGLVQRQKAGTNVKLFEPDAITTGDNNLRMVIDRREGTLNFFLNGVRNIPEHGFQNLYFSSSEPLYVACAIHHKSHSIEILNTRWEERLGILWCRSRNVGIGPSTLPDGIFREVVSFV